MIVAHRGHWRRNPAWQNSPGAVLDAGAHGWGVEIDLTWKSRPVIGHGGDTDPYWDLYAWLRDVAPVPVPCLVDIKHSHLDVALESLPDGAWIFDHELVDPDLPTRKRHLRYLARCTDEATLVAACAAPWAKGVWLDQPDGEWVTAAHVQACTDAGRAAFLVSPELHGRPIDLAQWRAVHAAGGGICTDLPGFADAVLAARPEVTPHDPWWSVHA